MKKKRIILLSVLASLAVSGYMQAAEPLSVPRKPAGPQGRRLPSKYQKSATESAKSFAKRANELYETLKDDWKCLLDRKRKCTRQQKGRIIGELLGLIALVSGVYLGVAKKMEDIRLRKKGEEERRPRAMVVPDKEEQKSREAHIADLKEKWNDPRHIGETIGDLGKTKLYSVRFLVGEGSIVQKETTPEKGTLVGSIVLAEPSVGEYIRIRLVGKNKEDFPNAIKTLAVFSGRETIVSDVWIRNEQNEWVEGEGMALAQFRKYLP